jgi:hypothetical protein
LCRGGEQVALCVRSVRWDWDRVGLGSGGIGIRWDWDWVGEARREARRGEGRCTNLVQALFLHCCRLVGLMYKDHMSIRRASVIIPSETTKT